MAQAPASATDNKKKIIFIAAGAGALILLLLIIFMIRGRAKKAAESQTETVAVRVGGMSAMRRGGGGRGGSADTGDTATTDAAKPAKPEITTYAGEPLPIREDPFVPQKPSVVKPPPPLPPPLPAVVNAGQGLRVKETSRPVATLRRTAGLVWNHDVYGLLQLGNNMYIVRPGDTVSEYIVSAITRDSIILYSPSLDRQIQVPLQGPFSQVPEQMGTLPVDTLGYGALDNEDAEFLSEASFALEAEATVPSLPEFPAQ